LLTIPRRFPHNEVGSHRRWCGRDDIVPASLEEAGRGVMDDQRHLYRVLSRNEVRSFQDMIRQDLAGGRAVANTNRLH
jgi:hypothetical protein